MSIFHAYASVDKLLQFESLTVKGCLPFTLENRLVEGLCKW